MATCTSGKVALQLRLRLHAKSSARPHEGTAGEAFEAGPSGRHDFPARGAALEATSTLTSEEWERLCESLETQG